MLKKVIYILIFIIFCSNHAFAQTQNAQLEYDSDIYTPKNANIKKIIENGNVNMLLYEKSLTETEKKIYLQKAAYNYYLATKINGALIEAQIGLARAYDHMNLDRMAKEYFYKAKNIDSKNPATNLYFANFYYRREDYIKALNYYKIAYENGLSRNYELNYRLGIIHEKLGDLEIAKIFYKRALELKPNNEILPDKIRLLDDLNYGDSQYYLFNKRKK